MSLELQSATLAPLVAQALNKPEVEMLDWHVTPLTGGASKASGIDAGVYRIAGAAQSGGETLPRSLILKGFGHIGRFRCP